MQPSAAAWIVAVAMFGLVLFSPAVLNDGDTYSHIATGNWMIGHHAVIAADPFSFSHEGAPWIAHEWLAELLLAASFGAGGWSGVVALTGIAASLAVFQLARHLARWLSGGAVLVLVVVAVSCITPRNAGAATHSGAAGF